MLPLLVLPPRLPVQTPLPEPLPAWRLPVLLPRLSCLLYLQWHLLLVLPVPLLVLLLLWRPLAGRWWTEEWPALGTGALAGPAGTWGLQTLQHQQVDLVPRWQLLPLLPLLLPLLPLLRPEL
jgi:hypothetical protein